jgi:hypothetical protein
MNSDKVLRMQAMSDFKWANDAVDTLISNTREQRESKANQRRLRQMQAKREKEERRKSKDFQNNEV